MEVRRSASARLDQLTLDMGELCAEGVFNKGAQRLRHGTARGPSTFVRRMAHEVGFDLDAHVSVAAGPREEMEHLVRYILRPPLKETRLRLRHDGVELTLKTRSLRGTHQRRFMRTVGFSERPSILGSLRDVLGDPRSDGLLRELLRDRRGGAAEDRRARDARPLHRRGASNHARAAIVERDRRVGATPLDVHRLAAITIGAARASPHPALGDHRNECDVADRRCVTNALERKERSASVHRDDARPGALGRQRYSATRDTLELLGEQGACVVRLEVDP
ncbi:MAG: transposase [Sandaracinaceae bacterium]|nr:transposase [Sandaracinaceae bacterium]MBP7680994.1 transposase [Deltaproteobacteria bacterium]MBK7156656.1 transposase [Sandaracinaceae bacterium]MBK7778470.1 transposase [Sandaracinaceae bacterium]MBK8412474.1 transposase [Sandaracinaceae bacterium]